MAILNEDEPKIEVRGRIDGRSPLYDVCKTSDTTLFRTIKELAEEAVAVRRKLAPDDGLEHPLSYRIRNMTSSEAVTYLLGVTQSGGQITGFVSGDKSVNQPSDKRQMEGRPEAKAEAPSASQSVETPDDPIDEDWERDIADAMDVLSEAPESK